MIYRYEAIVYDGLFMEENKKFLSLVNYVARIFARSLETQLNERAQSSKIRNKLAFKNSTFN